MMTESQVLRFQKCIYLLVLKVAGQNPEQSRVLSNINFHLLLDDWLILVSALPDGLRCIVNDYI